MASFFLKNRVGNHLEKSGFILALVFVFAFFSCGKKTENADEQEPTETEKVAALRKEVIAVHDEVMPLMTDIYQLKTMLKQKVADANITSEARRRADSIFVQLDSADRGMREWMRAFSRVNTAGIPETEALNTLNAELEKIKKVKNDMIRSVEAAKSVE